MSQPIVIVSGLPRSGTSVMMQMIHAGGMPALAETSTAVWQYRQSIPIPPTWCWWLKGTGCSRAWPPRSRCFTAALGLRGNLASEGESEAEKGARAEAGHPKVDRHPSVVSAAAIHGRAAAVAHPRG